MSRKKKVDPDWKPRPHYAWNSVEARAIKVLHQIVGRESAFYAVWRRKSDGAVSFGKDITEQLRAFAQAPDASEWVELTYRHAASWEETLSKYFDDGIQRRKLRQGSRAPWPWPPSLEGKLHPDPNGIPPIRDEDRKALSNEGQR